MSRLHGVPPKCTGKMALVFFVIAASILLVSIHKDLESTSTNFVYPMAQTFFVDKDNYPFGVFATRLHLYFYSA